MTDEDALLQAISWADPYDDDPRLIYADWFEENGQAERAELIRVQCELARHGVPQGRLEELRARVAELLTRNWARWLPPGCHPALPWHFHRGFVERLGHSGFFASTPDAEGWQECIRFYPDGTLLSAMSADYPSVTSGWLHKQTEADGVRGGQYSLTCGPSGIIVCVRAAGFHGIPINSAGCIEKTVLVLAAVGSTYHGEWSGEYTWVSVPGTPLPS
ncbi:MAG: TIGR02996 domain-containing protein [Gemmataceae bacterium]|nr:TIGR02996 domain-containing protein [Gemmataceae bacterium]